MWYEKLMNPLLIKLKKDDQENGQVFLNELFLLIKNLSRNPELGFFIGLIEKSFLKFEHAEDNSVSLVNFSKHVMGLTILYMKSNSDFAIWNSDISDLMSSKMASFLQIDSPILKFIHKVEFETFASLDHNVDINFDHFASILGHYSKFTSVEEKQSNMQLLQEFIDACQMLSNDPSKAFVKLMQKIRMQISDMKSVLKESPQIASIASTEIDFIFKGEDENLQLPLPKSPSVHRLSIFKKITNSELENPSGIELNI